MTEAPRVLPHPWDLHIDQCRGTLCVWCRAVLVKSVPAGTIQVVHQHKNVKRLVEFQVNSCPACAAEDLL